MATPSGGNPVSPGIVQYIARGIRSSVNYFFGPENPQPVSAPPGTPPRQLDYPTGYNLQIQPRNQEPITYQQMRNLADSFDLVRLCIETRKDQMAKMKWGFSVKREAGEKPTAFKQRNQKDTRLQELTDFFQSPDKDHTWQEWVRLILEDMLVIDAPTIVPLADQNGTLWKPGKKLFGLDVTDGATITRKIDPNGRTPYPPGVAYQQIIKGIPAVDFTRDQLVYKPRNLRVHKFFGFSPVEQIILTMNIGLRRQVHLLNFYTEGNVPEAVAQVPKEWSADQVAEFQNWFDSALSGNLAGRRKITFVPECGTIQFTHEPTLKDELDEWLARIVCFAFSLSPQAFIKQMNRATAETSVEQAAAEGLTPILLWFEDLMNYTLLPKYLGITDVEFSFQQETDENPLEEAEIVDRYLRNGSMTLDQAAEKLGYDPLPDGSGSRNMIYTASGAVPVDVAIDRADNPPEPDAVMPDGQPNGAGPASNPPNGNPGKKPPKKKFRGYR